METNETQTEQPSETWIYTLVSIDFENIDVPVAFGSHWTFQGAVEHLVASLVEDNYDEDLDEGEPQYNAEDAWNDVAVDYEGEHAMCKRQATDGWGWTVVINKNRLGA